jgi:flagellin
LAAYRRQIVLSIRTNVASLNAQRNMSSTTMQLEGSLSKLSSGYRITRAADDAAGLGVSTNLIAQVKSYNQAARNANDGLSVVQTGEAALNETANILTRLRELTMQSSSDGIGTTERGYIQEEADALVAELDRIDATTEFNGNSLFGNTNGLQFQVGIRGTDDDFLSINTSTINVDSTSLSVNGINLSSNASASRAFLANIDSALDQVSNFRSQLGAVANRLSSVINTIQTAAESAAASNSRIRDVDVAEETSNMSRSQVLMQAGISVLAQANQAPQAALQLLD